MSGEVSRVVCPQCRASAPAEAKPGDVCPADGRAWVTADVVERYGRDKLLGRTLGEGQRYALVGVLGAGGMGAVYRAVDRQSGEIVAVKAAHIDPRRSATARTLLMRLRREARVLSRLNHPRIVRVRGVGTIESEDLHYFVMDLAQGVSLGQLLRQRGRLETPLALEVADQVLAALGAAHELGFVHRDVKPQNVLVALTEVDGVTQADCTLIDFGIVKTLPHAEVPHGDEQRTRPGATIGTPIYMAPEQLSAGDIGPPTDVYAVGVLLYRMLSGEAPFVGTAAEVVAGHLRDPAPPLPVTLDVSNAVRHAVSVALRKRGEDRFADAGEMKGALKGQWSPSRTAPKFKMDAFASEGTVSDQQWAEDLLAGAGQRCSPAPRMPSASTTRSTSCPSGRSPEGRARDQRFGPLRRSSVSLGCPCGRARRRIRAAQSGRPMLPLATRANPARSPLRRSRRSRWPSRSRLGHLPRRATRRPTRRP